MTTDDAILTLKDIKKFMVDEAWFDAVNTAIEVLEKQIPKKPIERIVNVGFNLQMPEKRVVCPICGVEDELGMNKIPRELIGYEAYCTDCGQAIDWSENDD